MGNFDDDFALVDTLFAEAIGDTVTYTRPGGLSVSITAEVSMREYKIEDYEGFVTTIQATDFVVTAADLVLSGSTFEPKVGDQIKQVIGTKTHTYEAMELGGRRNKPAFEWGDPRGRKFVIHTKRISTV